LAKHRSVVPLEDRSGRCIEQISWRYAGGDLLVFFVEDVPKNPGVSIVSTIALNYPTDISAMDRIIRQAGQPSVTDGLTPWTVAMWCFGFTCSDMGRVLRDIDSPTTLLVHRGAGFTLENSHVAHEREREIEHDLTERGVRAEP